jgi:hypothetical protein
MEQRTRLGEIEEQKYIYFLEMSRYFFKTTRVQIGIWEIQRLTDRV